MVYLKNKKTTMKDNRIGTLKINDEAAVNFVNSFTFLLEVNNKT